VLCFFWGTGWTLKYYLDELRLQRVKGRQRNAIWKSWSCILHRPLDTRRSMFVSLKDAPEEWCSVAAAGFPAQSEFWEVRGTLSAASRSNYCTVAEETQHIPTVQLRINWVRIVQEVSRSSQDRKHLAYSTVEYTELPNSFFPVLGQSLALILVYTVLHRVFVVSWFHFVKCTAFRETLQMAVVDLNTVTQHFIVNFMLSDMWTVSICIRPHFTVVNVVRITSTTPVKTCQWRNKLDV
jgi:hypothetical protein